jgi:two-component system nitrate/nitrite response regulator NarL
MSSRVCVVVHPNPIFREGLKSILANTPFAPTYAAASAEDVPSSIARSKNALLLIGVRDANSLAETVSAARSRLAGAIVLVIGDWGNRELVRTALALGATSFIDENVATSTLIKVLELVAQGEPVVILQGPLGAGSAPLWEEAAVAIPGAGEPEPPETDAGPNPPLSRREATILKALVQGTPNKVIAYRLNITEATVKVHLKAILRKIQVKNRTQAAIWAMRHQPLQVGNGELGGNGSTSAIRP